MSKQRLRRRSSECLRCGTLPIRCVTLRRDDLAFGTDMARLKLLQGPGSAIVVCVDMRGSDAECGVPPPRILVTLLLLNEANAVRGDVGAAVQLQGERTLRELFDALPKYWSESQFECFEQCFRMLPSKAMDCVCVCVCLRVCVFVCVCLCV